MASVSTSVESGQQAVSEVVRAITPREAIFGTFQASNGHYRPVQQLSAQPPRVSLIDQQAKATLISLSFGEQIKHFFARITPFFFDRQTICDCEIKDFSVGVGNLLRLAYKVGTGLGTPTQTSPQACLESMHADAGRSLQYDDEGRLTNYASLRDAAMKLQFDAMNEEEAKNVFRGLSLLIAEPSNGISETQIAELKDIQKSLYAEKVYKQVTFAEAEIANRLCDVVDDRWDAVATQKAFSDALQDARGLLADFTLNIGCTEAETSRLVYGVLKDAMQVRLTQNDHNHLLYDITEPLVEHSGKYIAEFLTTCGGQSSLGQLLEQQLQESLIGVISKQFDGERLDKRINCVVAKVTSELASARILPQACSDDNPNCDSETEFNSPGRLTALASELGSDIRQQLGCLMPKVRDAIREKIAAFAKQHAVDILGKNSYAISGGIQNLQHDIEECENRELNAFDWSKWNYAIKHAQQECFASIPDQSVLKSCRENVAALKTCFNDQNIAPNVSYDSNSGLMGDIIRGFCSDFQKQMRYAVSSQEPSPYVALLKHMATSESGPISYWMADTRKLLLRLPQRELVALKEGILPFGEAVGTEVQNAARPFWEAHVADCCDRYVQHLESHVVDATKRVNRLTVGDPKPSEIAERAEIFATAVHDVANIVRNSDSENEKELDSSIGTFVAAVRSQPLTMEWLFQLAPDHIRDLKSDLLTIGIDGIANVSQLLQKPKHFKRAWIDRWILPALNATAHAQRHAYASHEEEPQYRDVVTQFEGLHNVLIAGDMIRRCFGDKSPRSSSAAQDNAAPWSVIDRNFLLETLKQAIAETTAIANDLVPNDPNKKLRQFLEIRRWPDAAAKLATAWDSLSQYQGELGRDISPLHASLGQKLIEHSKTLPILREAIFGAPKRAAAMPDEKTQKVIADGYGIGWPDRNMDIQAAKDGVPSKRVYNITHGEVADKSQAAFRYVVHAHFRANDTLDEDASNPGVTRQFTKDAMRQNTYWEDHLVTDHNLAPDYNCNMSPIVDDFCRQVGDDTMSQAVSSVCCQTLANYASNVPMFLALPNGTKFPIGNVKTDVKLRKNYCGDVTARIEMQNSFEQGTSSSRPGIPIETGEWQYVAEGSHYSISCEVTLKKGGRQLELTQPLCIDAFAMIPGEIEDSPSSPSRLSSDSSSPQSLPQNDNVFLQQTAFFPSSTETPVDSSGSRATSPDGSSDSIAMSMRTRRNWPKSVKPLLTSRRLPPRPASEGGFGMGPTMLPTQLHRDLSVNLPISLGQQNSVAKRRDSSASNVSNPPEDVSSGSDDVSLSVHPEKQHGDHSETPQ